MSFLQPGKGAGQEGAKDFLGTFSPRYWLCQSLFSMSGCFLCLSMWKAKVEHMLLFYSWPKKLCHLLLGTMAFFLLVHRHWQFSVCLFENVRIGSARQLVYPQKAHPPQSPSLSWHITATTYTENVEQSGKQDFVWLLFKESIYRNDTHSIFLDHGITRCFNNNTLLCKYWCATMG